MTDRGSHNPVARAEHAMPRRWRSAVARWKLPRWLSIHLVVGFAASAAALWAFFSIAEDLPEHGALDRFDMRVDVWLHAHQAPAGVAFFDATSVCGSEVVFALWIGVAIALFLRRRRLDGVIWVVALGGAVLLNNALKLVFERHRPPLGSYSLTRDSWSFPSGHATDGIVCYGMLAVLFIGSARSLGIKVLWIVATVVVVALIGFGRLYLGAHYFSDVMAGYCIGLVWLLVCIWVRDLARVRPS